MTELTLAQVGEPTLRQEDEANLVLAAQHNPAEFAPLYRQYVHPVYRYLYSRVGQISDAEDLTAQVFLEALESLGRYRNNGPFAAWLFTIARRRMIDHMRRRHPAALLVDHPDPATDLLHQVIHNEQCRRLQAQIAGLAEDEQELLRLRFAAGLSFAEIAALLDRREAAVKMSLYRLLNRLENQLDWLPTTGEVFLPDWKCAVSRKG
ncbi:MAG: RNA polymerase sigma factor [Anaerolineae bacterium]|nr:RNA polymerase sigma factor [Anaerolineae bacterium]